MSSKILERRPTPARLSVPCAKNDHSHCFMENCICKICHPPKSASPPYPRSPQSKLLPT
jgi:hypothetical protein